MSQLGWLSIVGALILCGLTYTVFGTSASGTSGAISHDAAHAAGWKLVGSGCGTGHTSVICTLFHK